jgi:hypothetical protein
MSDTSDADTASLRQRVDELTAAVNGLTHDLEDLAAMLAPAPDTGSTNSEAIAPAFASLEEWVDGFFLPTFRRQFGGELRWCRQWHDHPEACLRLEALRRSWEALRLDPTLGIATWLTNYVDPQLAALLARSGTFATCTPDRHAAG